MKKIVKTCANCALDIPENRDHDGYCRFDGIERVLQQPGHVDCPHWILKRHDSVVFEAEVARKLSENNYLEVIQS